MSAKSEFVLSQPTSLPAKEVVEKAVAAGFTVSTQYVHTARYNARHAKKGKRVARKQIDRARKVARARGAVHDTLEVQFIETAIDLGLGRSESIIAKIREATASAMH